MSKREYTATDYNGQLEDIAAFINDEAEAATASVRNSTITLVVVVLLLGAWFWFMSGLVRDMTDPEMLATESYKLLDSNMPDLATEIEGVMNDVAPEVADFIANKAVQEGVPYLVQRSEEFLVTYIDQMTDATAAAMTRAFSDVVIDNKDALRQALNEPGTGDEPSKALKPLRDKFHASLTDHTTGKRTEAGAAIDHSLRALRSMNRRLNELADADPKSLSRKDEMGQRLLRQYWSWVRSTSPESVGDDMPVAKPGDGAP